MHPGEQPPEHARMHASPPVHPSASCCGAAAPPPLPLTLASLPPHTQCTRPGCTDCAYCPAGMAGCEGSQYCVPPCQLGASPSPCQLAVAGHRHPAAVEALHQRCCWACLWLIALLITTISAALPSSPAGYAYNTGGCRTCGDVLPNCGRCSRCTGGPGCYDSMRCEPPAAACVLLLPACGTIKGHLLIACRR